MRRELLLAASLLIFVSLAAGIAYENGSKPDCPPGHACIMSGATGSTSSSASATTAVGANGTEYRTEVSMVNRSSTDTGNAIFNVSYSRDGKKKVSFNGRITAPTPCHVIEHEIEGGNNNSYTLNIRTVRDELDSQTACIQVISGIEYMASFETSETFTGEPFRLEVQHNGETVDTLERPEWVSEPREEYDNDGDSQGGLLQGLFSWFSSLF